MKLLFHPKSSKMLPFKFENRKVTSFHTVLGMWLLIHASCFMLGWQLVHVNKHEQNVCTLNRRHFDCIVVKEDICILVQISLKYQFTQFTDPHMHHITLSRNELTCPDDKLFHTTSPAGVSLRHLIYTAPYHAMIDMATANLKYCHPQRQTSVNARFPENLW